jgi:hypothetical protein
MDRCFQAILGLSEGHYFTLAGNNHGESIDQGHGLYVWSKRTAIVWAASVMSSGLELHEAGDEDLQAVEADHYRRTPGVKVYKFRRENTRQPWASLTCIKGMFVYECL